MPSNANSKSNSCPKEPHPTGAARQKKWRKRQIVEEQNEQHEYAAAKVAARAATRAAIGRGYRIEVIEMACGARPEMLLHKLPPTKNTAEYMRVRRLNHTLKRQHIRAWTRIVEESARAIGEL